VKFGLFMRVAAQRGRDEDRAHGLILEEARLAEEEGFDSVWFAAGHQLSGGSPFPLAAAAARRTRAIRLVVRPPLGVTHPLYTAEDAAALDLISGGRVIVAPPAASTDDALAAYGVDPGDAVERTWEAIEVLLKAWAPEPFRHQGRAWTIPAGLPEHETSRAASKLSVTPKPAQPSVPIWVAPASLEDAERAAVLGLPVVAESWLTPDEVRDLFAAHATRAAPAVGSIRVAIRPVHVADTDAHARAAVATPGRGGPIVGGVETVVGELHRYAELGVNYLVCEMALPGLSTEQVRSSTILFARGVAPRLRMYGYPEEIQVRTAAECGEPMLGYLKEGGWS
jgi:alkanesulfonate monooxygenase SsuD/methylene tetrahydromethanopterin reductase-like flavin-dependent oxidoreductase (luciferase family)